MSDFTVEQEVFIDRPAEEVFRFIADAENDIQWCPAVLEIQQVEGRGPGLRAVYEMRHAPGGMKFDAVVRVIAYEPPQRLQWIMNDSGHEICGTYRLQPVDGGTLLKQRSEVSFRGWMRLPGLFMKGFIARDVAKELRKQFGNLKTLLEREQNGSMNGSTLRAPQEPEEVGRAQ